ncbi:unnamed protein product [Discosporangium mesarthrocarpum]
MNLAMEEAGMESASVVIGVDFTRSNEWRGARTFGGKCMHDTRGPKKNPYEEVLYAVGHALAPVNRSGQIWCYGFGDEVSRDKSVFGFMPNDSPCDGLDQARGKEGIAGAVTLSGPTSFAPIIRKALDLVEDSGGLYHCLVIIADGEVTKEGETAKAIVEASSFPLSIIMVGIGDGPWDRAREFDNHLPKRKFDNFRFIDHQSMKKKTPEGVALAALAEVPTQYKAMVELGLLSDAHICCTSVSSSPGRGGRQSNKSDSAGRTHVEPSAPLLNLSFYDDAPQEFICPITQEVMVDPVVCADGHSYERKALAAWLATHDSSPMSNTRLTSSSIVPNHALRNTIESWRMG